MITTDTSAGPVYPYRDDADAAVAALQGVENMILDSIRRQVPDIDDATMDDVAQRVRIHALFVALPKFDATRGAKVSTYLCRCIRNAVRDELKLMRFRLHPVYRPVEVVDGGETLARVGVSDSRDDAAIEKFIRELTQNPDKYLSPRQAAQYRKFLSIQPGQVLSTNWHTSAGYKLRKKVLEAARNAGVI